MDKNAIKKYAVWARRELISRISQRAAIYGITDEGYETPNAIDINGKILTSAEIKQRQALIAEVKTKGYEQVMEEVAYTWFNRFIALRFMEVNGYLPSHVRVFTDDENNFKPQILTEAINLELEGLDMEKVFELKNANDNDELFKYLIIVQCNDLNAVLPDMFQKLEDYSELLFPDNILREGSVIEQMITGIAEEDWTDQIQIIGWLYQYYNAEKKDEVFAALKKNAKITKERIPAATQLFTPDWIVRYMVENSLGRLWVEGHPDEEIKENWKYYLEEAEREPKVEEQLKEIREEYAKLKPEDIKCIDPCCGSGHILVYMFDVLVQIYETYGYSVREATRLILENNLYGLDIDERAAQLACFSIMMKARQYDRRILSQKIRPHIYAIVESNGITTAPLHDMGLALTEEEYSKAAKEIVRLIDEMNDANEYGSLLNVTPCDWSLLRRFAVPRGVTEGQLMLDIHGEQEAAIRLQNIINVAEIMSQKYHIVVTNPPYAGFNGLNSKLTEYLRQNYNDIKYDLFACFIRKCIDLSKMNGLSCIVTTHSWLFLLRYEALRMEITKRTSVVNAVHMESGVFGTFGTVAAVFRNKKISGSKIVFNYITNKDISQSVPKCFPTPNSRNSECMVEDFKMVPGQPFVYWPSKNFFKAFEQNKLLGELAYPRQGLSTANNEKFLRLWFEVAFNNVCFGCKNSNEALKSNKKWFPYNKGGGYRKWYGNNFALINWASDGQEIKQLALEKYGCVTKTIKNMEYYFKASITWSFIGFEPGFRICNEGFLFDVAGSSIFMDESKKLYTLGLLNSNVISYFLSTLNPTMNFQANDMKSLPYIEQNEYKTEIEEKVLENIVLAKNDWDTFETSWGFRRHPLVDVAIRKSFYDNAEGICMQECYLHWESECENRFNKLKDNEEYLNKLFIEIYKLQNEIAPKVDEKSITIRKANLERDIKSFVSYAVGCMFGRYSLDMEELAFAGGEWNPEKYMTFKADEDNIIPICDDEYFEDDIVGRFVDFVKTVYGINSLESNLQFVADALGGSGTPREIIRKYFMNDFYKDHCKIYQKRPIYWLFDSGKKGGFKALIYMHRYQPDTIARIRTDYVHEQQSRYRTAIADVENRMKDASTSERVKLNKKIKKLNEQSDEIRLYEEKIHHLADQMILIDLDDGVKHNYAIFQDVLAKIK